MENSGTIVIAVSTNLDTRLVIIPPRSETVGHLRARIKTGHVALFPDCGEVDVVAVEVELFDHRYRLEDTLSIGQIFSERQAALYVEVTKPSPRPIVVCDLPRRNLTGAADLSTSLAFESGLPSEPLFPSLLETKCPAAERDAQDLGQKQEIAERVVVGAVFDTALGCAVNNAVAETSNNNNIRALGCGTRESDTCTPKNQGKKRVAGERVHGVEGSSAPNFTQVEIVKAVGKKSRIDNGRNVMKRVHEERGVLALTPTEKDRIVRRSLAMESCHKASSPSKLGQSGSKMVSRHGRSVGDGHTDEVETLDNTRPVSPIKTSQSGSKTVSGQGRAVDDGHADKFETQGAARPVSASNTSQPGSKTVSQHGKTVGDEHAATLGAAGPVSKVPLPSLQEQSVSMESGSSGNSSKSERPENHMGADTHPTQPSSSSSTCESIAQSEDSHDKSATEMKGAKDKTNYDNNCEANKPSGPGESSTEKHAGQKMSDSDSLLPSSDQSGSETEQTSSEESEGSEKMLLKEIRVDISAPHHAGAMRRNGRRSTNTTVIDPMYQRFIESQDGFDELISLSQQKLKGDSGHQVGPKLLNEYQEPLSPVPLMNDSLSIDLVPDTLGGDLDLHVSSQNVEKDIPAAKAVQGEGKESTSLDGTKDTSARSSVVKDKCVAAESRKDGEEDGQGQVIKSSSRLLSSTKTIDVNEAVCVKLETIAKGSISEVRVVSSEELSQARSDDSQQIQAAMQLTRMSMANNVGGEPPENSPSKKRRKRTREGISSSKDISVMNLQETLGGDRNQKDHTLQSLAQEEERAPSESPVRRTSGISNHEAASQGLETIDEDEPLGANSSRPESHQGLRKEELTEKAGSVQDKDSSKMQSSFHLATPEKPIKRKILGPKKDKQVKFLRKQDNGAATERRQLGRGDPEANETIRSDPVNTTSHVLEGYSEEVLHMKEHDVRKEGEVHNEKELSQLQTLKSHGRKKKKKAGDVNLVGNRRRLHDETEMQENAVQTDILEDKEVQAKGDFVLLHKRLNTVDEGEVKIGLTTVALENKKLRRKSGRESNTSHKKHNAEVEVVSDGLAMETNAKNGTVAYHDELESERDVPQVPVEEMDIAEVVAYVSSQYQQQRATVNLEEDRMILSSPMEELNTKKDSELKLHKKQSQLAVLENVEEFEDPAGFGTEHYHDSRLRTEWKSPSEFTGKIKVKSLKNGELKSFKDRSRLGTEVKVSKTTEQRHYDDEGVPPLSQEVDTGLNKGGSGKKGRKSSKIRQVVQVASSPSTDPTFLQTTKVCGSNNGKLLSDKHKAGSQVNTDTTNKDMLSKRDMKGRFETIVGPSEGTPCPYCGKLYSKKSGGFFRHKKKCALELGD